MITNDQINQLDQRWDYDTGFLGQVRQGIFNEKLYSDFLILLKGITIEEGECVDKKFIICIWYLPSFLDYWETLVSKKYPVDEYIKRKGRIMNELERILGFP